MSRRASSQPERWLLITHAFNMDGRAASQTVTDKIPHLLARGIEPVVISAVTGRRDARIEHHQVLAPLPSGLRFDLRHWLRARMANPVLRALALAAMAVLLAPFYWLEKLLVPLDSHWSWFLSARVRGARIIRAQRPRLIYSSGGASSAHLAGYLLAKRFRLPWIAEVHDPMVYRDWTGGPIRYRWALWIEGLICRHADVAWWFTPTALARARERHPELGERGRVLYPGANPPSPSGGPGYAHGPVFVLAHFGSLARNRNLAGVLEGLRRLLERRPELQGLVRLRTYGGGWDDVSRAALKSFPYPGIVEDMGRLEFDPATGLAGRERVMQAMRRSDCLLLIHGEDAFCQEYFPSKLYEYLWMQRPILGVIHDNADLERLLADTGHIAVKAGDAERLARELEMLLTRWREQGIPSSGGGSLYPAEAAVATLVGWAEGLR